MRSEDVREFQHLCRDCGTDPLASQAFDQRYGDEIAAWTIRLFSGRAIAHHPAIARILRSRIIDLGRFSTLPPEKLIALVAGEVRRAFDDVDWRE